MAAPARRLVFAPLQLPLARREPDVQARPTLVLPPPPVPPGEREEVRRLRASLQASVAAKVTSATELLHALENRRREELLPTTLGPFDALLGGGLPRGKV